MKIKNVIFDFGNVLVRWAPHEVLKSIFPEMDAADLFKKMMPQWIELNLGKVSEAGAVEQYNKELNLPKDKLQLMMEKLSSHQTFLPGSLELLKEVYSINEISLFAITDNVKEIIKYHGKNSNFLHYFKDVIVSAELGIMKNKPEIFQHLLDKYSLKAQECVFIDDHRPNIDVAQSVGMQVIHFQNALECRKDLLKLRVLDNS